MSAIPSLSHSCLLCISEYLLCSWSCLWTSKSDTFRPITDTVLWTHCLTIQPITFTAAVSTDSCLTVTPTGVISPRLSLSPLFWHLCVTMTEAFKPKSFDKRKVSTNGHSVYPPCLLSLSVYSIVLSPPLSPRHHNSYYFYLLTWTLLSLLTAPSL